MDGDDVFMSNMITGQHPTRKDHSFVALPDGTKISDPEIPVRTANPSPEVTRPGRVIDYCTLKRN